MAYLNCIEVHGRSILVAVRPTEQAAIAFMQVLRARFAERGIDGLYFIFAVSEAGGDSYVWLDVKPDPDAAMYGTCLSPDTSTTGRPSRSSQASATTAPCRRPASRARGRTAFSTAAGD